MIHTGWQPVPRQAHGRVAHVTRTGEASPRRAAGRRLGAGFLTRGAGSPVMREQLDVGLRGGGGAGVNVDGGGGDGGVFDGLVAVDYCFLASILACDPILAPLFIG